MDINDLTIGQLKDLKSLIGAAVAQQNNPLKVYEGKRCLIRTYSESFYIGDVISISYDGLSCTLKNALTFLKYEGGKLSLSAIANKEIKSVRFKKKSIVGLTNCTEYIEITEEEEKNFVKFIMDAD